MSWHQLAVFVLASAWPGGRLPDIHFFNGGPEGRRPYLFTFLVPESPLG